MNWQENNPFILKGKEPIYSSLPETMILSLLSSDTQAGFIVLPEGIPSQCA